MLLPSAPYDWYSSGSSGGANRGLGTAAGSMRGAEQRAAGCGAAGPAPDDAARARGPGTAGGPSGDRGATLAGGLPPSAAGSLSGVAPGGARNGTPNWGPAGAPPAVGGTLASKPVAPGAPADGGAPVALPMGGGCVMGGCCAVGGTAVAGLAGIAGVCLYLPAAKNRPPPAAPGVLLPAGALGETAGG